MPASHRYVDFGGAMREEIGGYRSAHFAQSLRFFIPQIGPAMPAATGASHTEPPPLPASKSAGFDTQLRLEGVRVVLKRMDAPASVQVAYRSRTYSYVFEAVAGLLAFAGAIRLLGRGRGEKWAYFIFVGLGTLVVSGAVSPRASDPWQMAALGVFGGVGIWLVAWFVGGVRAMAERRRASAARDAEQAVAQAKEFATRRAQAEAQATSQAAVAKPEAPPAKPEEPPTQTGA